MCVIVYKPNGNKLPSKDTLKKCFDHNPDGAGYMLPIIDDNGTSRVLIRKGLMTFDAFIQSLNRAFKRYDVNPISTPIIMHFRISTQGGVQKGLCHPYPVCDNYEKMRSLACLCNIGLCHNGIISRCSVSSYYGGCHYDYKTKKWIEPKKNLLDYNDTMTFIKDYASLIIDNDLHFADKDNKVKLLERLCEYSKLAIMTKNGDVKLIGHFEEKNGIYYSNLLHEVAYTNTGRYGGFKTTREIIKYNYGDVDDDNGYGGGLTAEQLRLLDEEGIY